jgi:hypothetical protein
MRNYRAWALRLARPALLPVAREGFRVLSGNRRKVSDWMGLVSDHDLAGYLGRTTTPRCAAGADE